MALSSGPISGSPISALGSETFTYVGEVGIQMGGSAPAEITEFVFEQQIEWDVQAVIDLTNDFEWNVGPMRQYWFRVEGCCKYPTAAGDGVGSGIPGGCEVLSVETDDTLCVGATGAVRTIQNILGTDLADVCQQLRELNWKWPICSVKKWTWPAENKYLDPGDACNKLVEIPFKDIPECFEFSLDTDSVVRIHASVQVYETFFFAAGSGTIQLGGTAPSESIPWEYEGVAGIEMGGSSPAGCSYFEYTGSGNIQMGGTAPVVSSSWSYTGSGNIQMGGAAPNESPDALPNYFTYTGSGTISLGGEAAVGGSSEGILVAIGEGAIDLLNEEPTYALDDEFAAPLEPITTTVHTHCENCTDVPMQLILEHPLKRAGVLQDFANRNGIKIPDFYPISYSRSSEGWRANIHYRGVGNSSNDEVWRIVLEWSCTNDLQSLELSSNVWKFSMLVTQSNLDTGRDLDSRILLAFPPEAICNESARREFNFTFSLDPRTEFVDTNYDLDVRVHVLNDEIGLFKTRYWSNRMVEFTVVEVGDTDLIERTDIKPIFPTEALLV